jgi:hypothetical protein
MNINKKIINEKNPISDKLGKKNHQESLINNTK